MIKNMLKLSLVFIFAFTVFITFTGCQWLQSYALDLEYDREEVKLIPKPLVYEKEGQVFIACGENILKLKGAQVISDKNGRSLRGVLSEDNSTLYYISDYNIDNTTGTLMAVKTDCKSQPQRIDTGVYAATISGDGNRALFLKNLYYGAGELYDYERNNRPVFVAGTVIPEEWGFSPNGDNYYFRFSYEDKNNDYETLNIMTRDNYYQISSYVYKQIALGVFYLGEDGKLLYRSNGDIYLHNGIDRSYEEAKDAQVLKVCGRADEYLYTSAGKLWHKAPGQEAVLFSDKPEYAVFQYTGQRYRVQKDIYSITEEDIENLRTEFKQSMLGDRFLLVENNGSIYDQLINGEKALIAGPGASQFFIDHRFNHVVFMKDHKTYIAHREKSGWSEPSIINGLDLFIRIGEPVMFDSADRCYYYIKTQTQDIKGTFCRVKADTNEVEELIEGAHSFTLVSDTPYVYTADGISRILDNKIINIPAEQGFRDDFLYDTSGGVFLETYSNDIFYLPESSDKPREICLGTDGILSLAGIEATIALPADTASALKGLYEDAKFYIEWMAGNEPAYKPHYTPEEDAALAEQFKKKQGLPAVIYPILEDFYTGFLKLSWRMKETNIVKDQVYYQPVINHLENAAKAYEDYNK